MLRRRRPAVRASRSNPTTQVDQLLPALTVRETLSFAEACLGPSATTAKLFQDLVEWEAANGVEKTPEDETVGGRAGGGWAVGPRARASEARPAAAALWRARSIHLSVLAAAAALVLAPA